MSSPLDRIEARAKEAAEALRLDGLGIGYEHMGDMHRDFVPLVRDVLALVNVAKAAEKWAHQRRRWIDGEARNAEMLRDAAEGLVHAIRETLAALKDPSL